MSKRAVIFGARGYIGSAAARAFLAAGWEVLGMSRTPAPDDPEQAGLATASWDSARIDALRDVLRPGDVLVYALAKTADEEQMVTALQREAERVGGTFIFTSGTTVFAVDTGGEWNATPTSDYEEFSLYQPMVSRRRAELLVLEDGRAAARHIVVRPPVVWSDNRCLPADACLRSLEASGACCYLGKGLNSFSHVHVEDLADLFVKVAERGEDRAVYHAVAGEVASRWLAERIALTNRCEAQSVDRAGAAEIWGGSSLLPLGITSRSLAPRSAALGWVPRRTDLLAELEARGLFSLKR